jgi:glucose/arabinose dehydrogenase
MHHRALRSFIFIYLSALSFTALTGCSHSLLLSDSGLPLDESESDRASTPVIPSADQELSPHSARTKLQNGRGLSSVENTRHTRNGYLLSETNCGRFPRVQVGTRPGYCLGFVAGSEDGLIFPRTIAALPGSSNLVVVDMGGWNPGSGRVLLLDPSAPEGHRIKVLISKLKSPHGLAIGPDGLTYISETDRIFRFNPTAAQPSATIQTVLHGLPNLNLLFKDGTKLAQSDHPLKQFLFDKDGNIYVNVGAPSDNCTPNLSTDKSGTKIIPAHLPPASKCEQSTGPNAMAAIWKFTAPATRIFPTLSETDANPAHEVFAGGLRNSMAMAIHPSFPNGAFVQGENGRDLPDLNQPAEKLNVVEKGKYYGWPYCVNSSDQSPEYESLLNLPGPITHLCSSSDHYNAPLTLMPPHVAPLSALYYTGQLFPNLSGRLLMTWHGYLPAASRIVSYDVDARGVPNAATPAVNFKMNCNVDGSRTIKNLKGEPVPGIQFEELVGEWYRVDGIRPQGAPVGLSQSADGALWIVEDKNQTILRMDVDPTNAVIPSLPCGGRSDAEVDQLMEFVKQNPLQQKRLTNIRTQVVERFCIGCHAGFDLKPEIQGADRDWTTARFMLTQSSWIFPGNLNESMIHRRTHALGAEKPMPMNTISLLASDVPYAQAIKDLDQFILEMVPGKRFVVKGQSRSAVAVVKNPRGAACGILPIGAPVIVINLNPPPPVNSSLAQIYKPADKDLNGACSPKEGYYVYRSLIAPAL